jgi:hypothetical protein
MDPRYVTVRARRREIEGKLAELAALGLVANEPFSFAALEDFAEGEYPEEQEYTLLLSFLGGDDIDPEDPETPLCRCDALYTFDHWCIFDGEAYAGLIPSLAQLAGDDLELAEAYSELELPPAADVDPDSANLTRRGMSSGTQRAIRDARVGAISAGFGWSYVRIEANGQRVELEFQQESCWFDWAVMRSLAALARLRTAERRFFDLGSRSMITVGYLPLEQIEALAGLVRLRQLNSSLPLPRYSVRDLAPG